MLPREADQERHGRPAHVAPPKLVDKTTDTAILVIPASFSNTLEDGMVKSALFISTLNEIEGLTALAKSISFNAFDECYALDGGSTDGTISFYEEHGIPVTQNVKKGEIFNVGASLTTCDELVFFAPDGNEDPDDLVPLLEKLREGYDMVIASRFLEGARNEEDSQIFKWRKWANQVFTQLVRLRWGGEITDTINGYRAVRRAALLAMNLEPTGFDIEFQMSIRALKLGMKIAELPTQEGGRIGGESTAYSFHTGWMMLNRLVRESFVR
jgi:glycosyltransferase involved in cell wall biosynthesis